MRAQYPKVTLFAHSGSPGFVRAGNLTAFAAAGGFDGIFTYDPYSYQASDFPAICAQARAALLQCSPSVSPGYDATRATSDSRVRDRNGGVTYDSTWQGAITAAPEIVTITSYNEWHEGSQIEPAMPYCVPNQGSCYSSYTGDYGLGDPQAQQAYLGRTAFWAAQYRSTRSPNVP